MPAGLWLTLLVFLVAFVLWFTSPPRVVRVTNEYVTPDGDTVTVRGQFDGKQATAEVVVFVWKGTDLERVLDRAVAEATRRYGELELRAGGADPSLSRIERVRSRVRHYLVRE